MRTVALLFLSNAFMTFAWYGHLKHLNHKPLIIAILASWGIAFFEYLLQVPANRYGYGQFSLSQLKVLQEIITMCVFAGFATWSMQAPLNLDFLWAMLCLVAAAYFMFRGPLSTGAMARPQPTHRPPSAQTLASHPDASASVGRRGRAGL